MPVPFRRRPAGPLVVAALAAFGAAAGQAQVAGPVPAASAPASTPAPAPAPAPAPVSSLQTVLVVPTPLPGHEVPQDHVPANVQSADDRRLRALQSLDLPDFMATQLAGVSVNETQGNPFQATLNYRGFSASPLLGQPQGLSVFLDGVRVNEPFGDVVNWDLIPTGALESVTLLPGSNPLFGLNTLGGALVLRTKSGDTHPGGELEVQGGSFGRVETSVSEGQPIGAHGHLFAAFAGFDEDGWRDGSPSHVRQLFVKGGERTAAGTWELSLNHGESNLVGNGLTPEPMLAVDRRQVYTRPDQTRNHLTLLTLGATRRLPDGYVLSGTAYARGLRATTLNGDLNDDDDGVDDTNAGVEHRTATAEDGAGLALQLARSVGAHRVTLGASLDESRHRFQQASAEGSLDASRTVQPGEDPVTDALITGRGRTASVYAADLVALAPTLQLTLSGRFNDTHVRTVDVGRATLGLDTALDGAGTYARFNPAVGATWQASPTLTAFGGFSQGNRAPSPIELGCADPQHPCVLPNALQGDPPLKQVVSRTLEAGVRGRLAGGVAWSAAAWRTDNVDDLLFIGNGHAQGFFANVGRTRRQGVEVSASQQARWLDWQLAFGWLDATFRSPACLLSPANSSAGASASCPGEDEIAVGRGDALPGLPARTLKVTLDARPVAGWRVGLQLSAASGQKVRGNENGQQQPDGGAYEGTGRLPGYALAHLTARWQLRPDVELFGKVANLFDRRYATGGQLGVDAFDGHGTLRAPADWRNEQFDAPGAPRAAWVGVRWSFGDS